MTTASDPFQPHDGDPGTVDAQPEESGTGSSSPIRRFRLRKRRKELITDATRSPEQNIRSRERVYMVLQLVRFPFILLSILSAWFWGNWWLAGILFVVSVPLPWIAVMIGNGQGEKRDPRTRNVYKPAVAREHTRLEMQRRRELTEGGDAPTPGTPTIIDHDE